MTKYVACRVVDTAPLTTAGKDCPSAKTGLAVLQRPALFRPADKPRPENDNPAKWIQTLLGKVYRNTPFQIGINLNTAV